MKSLLTISMVLGTILVLESSANAFIFGWGNSNCCRTSCCEPTCCKRTCCEPTCCRSSGFLGYHGGGVWGW